MQNERQPKSLDELIALTREALDSGELSEEQKVELEERCRTIKEMPEEERESLHYFLRHMPYQESDLTLIVLKGHLLLEQKVREFINERMLNPEALKAARLTSHQAICLAEALTLPNDDPKVLWSILRNVNTLRNDLAHNLAPQKVERLVRAIESEFATFGSVQSGFVGILGHLYAQLAELCRMAREPEYRVKGKNSSL